MIRGFTGGIQSGKTSFALHDAMTSGREGMDMITHRTPLLNDLPAPPHFTWQTRRNKC